MRGIVEGLAYMHKYDLMHRDLKLENIMFREVESMEPLIVDFGLAGWDQINEKEDVSPSTAVDQEQYTI
ncbi:unnamed protein product [Sphagnum balticum]